MVPERAGSMQAMLVGPQTAVKASGGCAPRHIHTYVASAAASRREVLSLALLASMSVAKRAVASEAPASSSCGGTDTQRGGAAYDAFADSYDDLNDGAVADVFGVCRAVPVSGAEAGWRADMCSARVSSSPFRPA